MGRPASRGSGQIRVRYPDVDPEVLAREEAAEREAGLAMGGVAWIGSGMGGGIRLPSDGTPPEMALVLLAAGEGRDGARQRADAMRRRAVGEGDIRRVRFWAEVMTSLRRAELD
jgi:hypothetical protein